MTLADSDGSQARVVDPFPRDSVFDVTHLLDALEEGRARNLEILATLGAAEGPWVNALRDLSSHCENVRARGREAAYASWRQVWEFGEAWEVPRMGRAVEQLRQVHREHATDELAGDLHDALALVHWVALVEDPFGIVAILAGLEADPSGEAVVLALSSLGDFTEEVIDRSWDRLEKGEKACACRLLSRTRGAWGAARLVESLDAMEPDVRVAAAEALASRPEPDALGELVRSFEQAVAREDVSSDREVEALDRAIVAIATSAEVESERVVATLSEWSLTSEESVRIGFAHILAKLVGSLGSNWANAVLSDPSPAVREVAASTLSSLSPENTKAVRDQLLGDEADRVRMAGAVSLGEARDREALDRLERLIADPCEGVRTAALRSLGIRLAREGHGVDEDRVFSWVDEGIRQGGLSAIAAVELLPRLPGSRARARVAQLLASPSPDFACAVLAILRREPDPSLVAAVRKALDHPDASVRIEAAEVLVVVAESSARTAILSRVEREHDPQARSALRAVVRRLDG